MRYGIHNRFKNSRSTVLWVVNTPQLLSGRYEHVTHHKIKCILNLFCNWPGEVFGIDLISRIVDHAFVINRLYVCTPQPVVRCFTAK